MKWEVKAIVDKKEKRDTFLERSELTDFKTAN
jgi:hypothetical protein